MFQLRCVNVNGYGSVNVNSCVYKMDTVSLHRVALSLVSLRYLFLASTLLLIITLVISIHKLKFEETEGELSVRHYLFLCIRLGWISSLSR